MSRLGLVWAFLMAAALAQADEELVLKDGREFTVKHLARRGGKVRFETRDGKVFEIPEDQVVSPSLDSIPSGTAAVPGAEPSPGAPQVLELKDGRKISVRRLARRGGRVRLETTEGKVFEVDEGQVVSPPLAAIASAAPPQGAGERPQILSLRDGRRISVLRLARREGMVLFETSKGERFSVAQDQVVSPDLSEIPELAPPPAVGAGAPPAAAALEELPLLPVGTVTPLPPTLPQPHGGTQLSDAEFVPYPNRWDVLDKLPPDPRLVRGSLIDPYNQNPLKGDRPILGDDVFLVLSGDLESPLEARRLPVTNGVSTESPGSSSFFGAGDQFFATPNASVSAELFSGQTAFRPKAWAVKVTGVFDLNDLSVEERNQVTVDVRSGETRLREFFALEEAFGEAKLKTLSANYDFVSLRAGIQPFVSDFRGFVFSDRNLGARLFGNLDSNRWQYNAAFFDLLEKDTNSDLNTLDSRRQKVAVVNVFRQDVLAEGYTVEASFHWSRDDPDVHYDKNGVLTRPAAVGLPVAHEVDSKYVGIAGDGHIGRLNLSDAFYYAFGEDDLNAVAGRATGISASLGALEASVDRDWVRLRVSGLWASGDSSASDGKARGFDSIYDNPNFAGGPFSFWNRSAIALSGTNVLLKPSDTFLPDLRSSKFEGQANFVNPGLRLVGLGVDAQVTPKLKAVANANYLWFDQVATLEALLFQTGLQRSIGLDWGAGVTFRPLLSENVVVTAGITGLLPGRGFDLVYGSEPCGVASCATPSRTLLNAFVNLKLTY